MLTGHWEHIVISAATMRLIIHQIADFGFTSEPSMHSMATGCFRVGRHELCCVGVTSSLTSSRHMRIKLHALSCTAYLLCFLILAPLQ